MSIAEKILRAKADYDAVYEAGKAAGGGETTEIVIQPSEIEDGICWDTRESGWVEDASCALYDYYINNMFGATAKIKTVLPENSEVLIFGEEEGTGVSLDYSISEDEFEFPISCNRINFRVSCVKTEGLPQVVLSFNGIIVEPEPVSHTSCFDGTFEGEFIDNDITSVRYGAFAECTQITKLSLPNCTTISGNYAFYHLDNAEEILLPNVTGGVFAATFNFCGKVKRIDLRNLGGVKFDNNCFRYCYALEKLILGGDAICTVANDNVLGGVPTTMTVYVPTDLVPAYQGTSPWSKYEIKSISTLGV